MKASEFIDQYKQPPYKLEDYPDRCFFISIKQVEELLQKIGNGEVHDDIGGCDRRPQTIGEKIAYREGEI